MALLLLTCLGVLVTSLRLAAQAPLATDDTAIAPVGTVHVEVFGQFVRLPAAVRPATAQRTLVLTLGYGLASRLEVGFDFPLIGIVRPQQISVGTGDLNLTASTFSARRSTRCVSLRRRRRHRTPYRQ